MSLVIIFDWDDTILARHYIGPPSAQDRDPTCSLPVQLAIDMEELEEVICKTLDTLLGYTPHIKIITNAEYESYRQACLRYMPNLYRYLEKHNINVISAHDEYKKVSSNHIQWKYYAMLDVIKSYKSVDYLLNIGDGVAECEAGKQISSQFNLPYAFIQFKPQPSVQELKDQWTNMYTRVQPQSLPVVEAS